MTNITAELKEVVALTKIVYTQNFTKSSNYIYFKDNACYISNTEDTLKEEECIIFHTFQNTLPFNNLGIPAKELHGVLDSITESASYTQKEDHIIITDGNKEITLPSVTYTPPPSVDINGLNYTPIPSADIDRVSKRLLQFTDKTDVDGSKIHFIGDVISTDINTIHSEVIGVDFPDFAIPLQIFSIMSKFAHLAVDDYLYMRTYNGTVLVTQFYPVMDLHFLEDLHKGLNCNEVGIKPIYIPKVNEDALFKVFGFNTKKPDREVIVDINAVRITISTGDDLTGFVSVDLDSRPSNPIVKFKIGTEKLFTLLKDYDNLYLTEIAGMPAIWGKIGEESNKYVVIEKIT